MHALLGTYNIYLRHRKRFSVTHGASRRLFETQYFAAALLLGSGKMSEKMAGGGTPGQGV